MGDAMNERIALGVMLAVLLGAPAGQVRGQPAFDRPITMVVPLPAGGTADLLCRLAAERASLRLGQQIVIDNRAGGAGGRVGTESVLRSPPDGHTLLCAPQLTYSITHLVFTRTAFDTRAMEPVSVLATYPLIVLARSGLPVDDLPKLIAYAKINPGNKARAIPDTSSVSS
jgi:tripartite-type tricarboxylate transporter receptor subunit TctC